MENYHFIVLFSDGGTILYWAETKEVMESTKDKLKANKEVISFKIIKGDIIECFDHLSNGCSVCIDS